jgi:murein DD-endopeptidase MepM/ murein hydrolase activator NlpD
VGLTVLAKKLAMKLMKEFAKKKLGGDDSTSKFTKIILALIIAIFVILYIVVMTMIMQFNNVVCRGILNNVLDNCPRPIIEESKLKDLSIKIKKVRDGAMDQTNDGFRFRDSDESASKEKSKLSEAQKFLLILEQLDTEVWSIMGYNNKDYNEGGKYENTNYGKTLRNAKGSDGRIFDWATNKESDHYFMQKRFDAWQCFLIGDACGFGILGEKIIPDKDVSILSQIITDKEFGTKESRYKTMREVLEKYYDYSLYKGIPNGEEDYKKRLDQLLEDLLYNDFPEQGPGDFGGGFSSNWIVPMEKGTYNFAYNGGQDYGKRSEDNGRNDHKGIDFGTSGASNIPIYAMKEGVVKAVGFDNGIYGGIIVIDHQNGFFSQYQHMKLDDILVKPNQKISQGQMITAAGQEGASDGIHLHWEICKGTRAWTGNNYLSVNNKLVKTNEKAIICEMQVDPTNPEVGMILETTGQNATKQNVATKYFNDNKTKAKNGAVIIMPGFVPSLGGAGGLGSISGKYESSGDPSLCVHNPSDPGGLSCGKYQIAAGPGTLSNFINFLQNKKPEYYKFFKGVPQVLSKFGPAFKKAYNSNPAGFTSVQHDFIAYSHYHPQVAKIKSKTGYDILAQKPSIQEMFWSFSVQHNNNTPGAFYEAVGGGWKTMTDKQIISKMYDYRYDRWSCCRPRYIAEKKDVLALADKEEKAVAGN